MTFQQLRYVLAVDNYRHFVTASDKSHVTQATLSMMLKKLEVELGIIIFDRTRHPVIPTEIGKKIIAQAKVVIKEGDRIMEIVQEEQGRLSGDLKVGIIPTLAPYLLPLFLNSLMNRFPEVNLEISELTTVDIIKKLEQHDLDVGLLAIPLNNHSINEQTLFYEEFVVYASSKEKIMEKKYVLADDIDINKLWLLEEGHCLRSQVINLCELKDKEKKMHQLNFLAGTIETLKKIVEINQGITILPALALRDMTARQKKHVRFFKSPAPVREIGLVTHRYFAREKLVDALKYEIMRNVPVEMRNPKGRNVVAI